METTAIKGAAEIRETIAAAQARITDARTRLGAAVTNGKNRKPILNEIASLEDEIACLEAAIPFAEKREAEAAEEAKRAEEAATAARKAEAHERRLVAARRVDAALQALGEAFQDYSGGATDIRRVRRLGHSIQAALTHWAPHFGVAVEAKRVSRIHARPLADSEQTLGA